MYFDEVNGSGLKHLMGPVECITKRTITHALDVELNRLISLATTQGFSRVTCADRMIPYGYSNPSTILTILTILTTTDAI